MRTSEVRGRLVDAMRLDLVGPAQGLGSPDEILPEPPSRWYLTGFLVPLDADEKQRKDEAGDDELDQINDAKGLDDRITPDPSPARRSAFPSSAGMSFLVKQTTKKLRATVSWGDTSRSVRRRGAVCFIGAGLHTRRP